ncbi:MAG TPA: NAD-dependent epimerase/dehydratase family protein [Burkholderiaceae bacterium]|nr:NAD-dependent epimerase/dehydratase family protein [Burkholderiaceae bacterium]
MHLLITGATGTLGRPLCAELLRRGARLTVLSRQPPERVRARCGAAADVWADLAAWTPEVAIDAVINLAGEPIADHRWTAAQKHRIEDSRVAATERIVQAIASAEAPQP